MSGLEILGVALILIDIYNRIYGWISSIYWINGMDYYWNNSKLNKLIFY